MAFTRAAGVDGSTMYGDYYYLKSLVALRELPKE
jgi:hypothetical protein